MAQITLNIPNEKAPRLVAALKALYPVPVDEAGEPRFNDNQWARECVKRWLIQQVARYEQQEARAAIQYQEDEGLVE